MSHDDRQEQQSQHALRVGWLRVLLDAYGTEHDWAADADPGSTSDMLNEVRRLYDDLAAQIQGDARAML